MKRIYSISSLALSLFILTQSQAQTIDDALIFSREDAGTSARIRGLGNAQTALGGDISSINGNPAGLGFYSRSDISLTLNQLQNNSKINYLGTDTKSKKGNFGIDQAGVVFHFPTNNNGWKNFNIGISYNKNQNFNNFRSYEGTNGTNTIVSPLIQLMYNSPSFEQDFYNTSLANSGSNIVERYPAPDNTSYFPLASENQNKNQYNEHVVSGNKSKTVVSFGANYNHKLYIGGSLGITSFRFNKQTKFIENGWTKSPEAVAAINPGSIYVTPNNPKGDYLDASYELFDTFHQMTEGSGVDAKIGLIYKPTVDWNLGFTITTPTWTSIKEDTDAYTDIHFYEDETSDFPIGTPYESDIYQSGVDYNLTSPWKFAFGASKFFSRGLITADAEIIDYRRMEYAQPQIRNAMNGLYSAVNRDIEDTYRTTANFRIGGEYLINNILSGRAGFNYFGNPYKDAEDSNYSGSLGLGVKLTPSIYLDAAVSHQINSYKEAAYIVNQASPIADITHNRTNVAFTIGAKF